MCTKSKDQAASAVVTPSPPNLQGEREVPVPCRDKRQARSGRKAGGARLHHLVRCRGRPYHHSRLAANLITIFFLDEGFLLIYPLSFPSRVR